MTRALVTPVRPETEPVDRHRSDDPGRLTVTIDRTTSAIVQGGHDPLDRRHPTAAPTTEADPDDASPTDAELWFG